MSDIEKKQQELDNKIKQRKKKTLIAAYTVLGLTGVGIAASSLIFGLNGFIYGTLISTIFAFIGGKFLQEYTEKSEEYENKIQKRLHECKEKQQDFGFYNEYVKEKQQEKEKKLKQQKENDLKLESKTKNNEQEMNF